MVKLQLSIKAALENVTDLVPAEDDFEFFFKVKCNSCHEEHPKEVSMNRVEERELTSGKGNTAHFVWRCSNCKRESSAKFDTVPPKPYSAEANGQLEPLVVLDCRGLEFVGFNPRGIWKCKGLESNTLFTDVDLTEGEWTDYDEKAAQPVSIMEIESEWARAS
ncbi:hypothetical protein PNOK_0231500 [Pyrrhoderma noxium]|uniref:DUF866-domain-containing protein n=1 Tax=Pyrrhoderma noxium TaxID=2282107 RepID=A0A286URY3_9AGAM|nr:hypothetical protein PNOK_0231500 [Pyrrhoderma noxium]